MLANSHTLRQNGEVVPTPNLALRPPAVTTADTSQGCTDTTRSYDTCHPHTPNPQACPSNYGQTPAERPNSCVETAWPAGLSGLWRLPCSSHVLVPLLLVIRQALPPRTDLFCGLCDFHAELRVQLLEVEVVGTGGPLGLTGGILLGGGRCRRHTHTHKTDSKQGCKLWSDTEGLTKEQGELAQ